MQFHLKVGNSILIFTFIGTSIEEDKVTMIGEILLVLWSVNSLYNFHWHSYFS